ncbi:putative ribonuclease H-like domain-containing protein [Tanacetum coccineum]
MTTAGTRAVVNTGKGKMDNDLKKSRWVWRPKGNYMDHESKEKGSFILKKFEYVDPKGISMSMDHAVVDSGFSIYLTSNKAYLSDYEDYNGGFVAFRSDPKGGKITGKGKIRTANLDFDDVIRIGPIPGMTPTQALTTIQTMAGHSQKWHDRTSSMNISSISNTDGLAAVISKLNNLGHDMKKLEENVDQVKYGEFGRPAPFSESTGSKFHVGPPGYYTRTDNQTPSGEKRPNLVKTINNYMEGATKRQAEQDEWLKTFYAKSLWATIKSRFRGNDESKNMQRNVLKHQFENFTTAPNESLDKAYDSQIALIMRNKPDIDQTDIDDLYNNLRVYKDKMKRSSSSTSNSHNLAFLSSENTSSTNEVSSTPGADEVVCSFFAQQTTSPPLDNKDLQQIDQDDLKELDIRWQVAMLTVRVRRFIQKTGRNLDFKGKQLVTFDKRNAITNEPSSQALVAQDGLGGYYWSNDFDKPVNYALMAISSSSSSSSSDNESETDSEISMSVFEVRSSDEEIIPTNDRFYKADGYHAVPPPITGNFLTPRADISFAGLDEYVIRKKIIESKTSELKDDTSESKTNDEDDVSEVNTVNPVKTNKTQTVKTQVDKIGQISQKEGIGFKKIKAFFVCKSTDHLIKDYDFYAKKSPEPKLKTMVNTSQRVVKPVWDNAKRVNHQKISNKLKYPQTRRTFIPKGVLTKTGLINHVRPNGKRAVHTVSTARPISTARLFAPKIAQTGSVIRPIYPRMDNVRPRASYSLIKRSYYTRPAVRHKYLKQDVKTSGVKNITTARTRVVVNTSKGKMDNALKKSRWVWRPKGNYMDHESKEKGSFILKKFEYVNLDICLEDHAVVDSGCSSHMTSNKAYLSDYEDYNRGFVAFGSYPKGAPRQNGVYSLDLKNIVPFGGITCLYANATTDESKLWHGRLGHVNFKNINKLVKGRLVRGLPSKVFVNDHTYVAYKKGKQHKASCLENQLNHKVKIIRSDHGIEFKNHAMNELCAKKGINREFSMARTPQQNGVAERKNRTLIEAARIMLTDSLLPIPIWAEAVNTACYILNRVLVTNPQNKTPYKLLIGFLVEDVVQAAQEKPSENFPKDKDIQDSEDVAKKRTTYVDKKLDHALQCDLRGCLLKKLLLKLWMMLQDKLLKKKRRGHLSTANTPYASATSTPTGANTGGSSFVYIRGQILIDASTLPNADLPIDPNMPDLEDDSNVFLNDGIFSGAYDDKDVCGEADFNNIDNTIDFSPIPTLRVSILVELPFRKKPIGTKWVFRNKRDERSIVVKNKARLVAQGFRQEEGIDYDEVFAPVARIEAIRLFLAFASFMGFPVYQMDIKSAFLYGTIEEEVYVHQPPGFVDPSHQNKVYKVIKALYGLHQAPRAWYETLSSFLLKNGFRRGIIDKTLFIKRNKSDIIFQMSSMGELTFFLGLQVKQQPNGIFISQDKYVADILKKFDFCSIKTATTPIVSNKPLVKDEDSVDVDVHVYRSMIGSLMYLTTSSQDIMFAVCACARFQVTPKASHLNAVKRIFRYLKHQPKLGLWYPRDSPFELEAFSNSDYGGASLDRKSTTGIAMRKGLIDVIKIHTDANVADLLIKGFDVTRFNFWWLTLEWSIYSCISSGEENQQRKEDRGNSNFHEIVGLFAFPVRLYHAFTNQEVGKEVQAKHRPPQGMIKECEKIIHKEEIWKEGVCIQIRWKKSKPESTLDDSIVFDDQDHGIEYMETEEAVDEGRKSGKSKEVKLTDDTEAVEDKGSGDKGGNVEELVSAVRQEDNPKDKGKGVLKESPINKVKRSDLDAAQIAKDAEITRLVHENELAEMEREREERHRQDQVFVDYIASLYDEIQAKMDSNEELAARLQMEERDVHNRRKALYIKEQERDADFVPIGPERDEKMIDKMNKKAAGMDEKEVPESTKVDNSLSKRSSWLDIIRKVNVLRTKGINLLDLIRKNVGNGLNTLFLKDPWLDDLALKHKFPRLYALDNYKQITIVEKINHASMVDTFRRPPRGGDEEE